MNKFVSLFTLFLSVFIIVMTAEQSVFFDALGSTDKIKSVESVSVLHSQIKKSKTYKVVLFHVPAFQAINIPYLINKNIFSQKLDYFLKRSNRTSIRGPPSCS